jgi:Fic family protein
MWKNQFIVDDEINVHLSRLESKKKELDTHRPLPTFIVEKIKTNLALEWTYNSNAIEGNTITLRETQMILEEGVTIKGKSLREHFETFNHHKAISFLYQLAAASEPIRGIDILKLHEIVLNNIEEHYAGRIRTGNVRINGANFTPPAASKVSELFDELIEWIQLNPNGLDMVSLATLFHHRFVWIHPFFDGNGRTVRLAMNLLLLRNGYPPAIILRADRKKYYEALNQANNGQYKKLQLLMIQAVERTLNIYLAALPGSTYEYSSITTLIEEERMPYGQEYLSLLARQGKIDAYKEGNVWYTSKNAVNSYMVNRKRQRKN